MAVGGKVREAKEWKKSTGFFAGEPVCINPDKEKLEKLLQITLEKDPEYLGTKEEEVEVTLPDGKKAMMKKSITKCDIVFWLKDLKSGDYKSVKFFLKDTPRLNKDKTKTQYINAIGTLSWADKPENLPDWFVTREFRVAHEGEEEMYNFITAWLSKVDFKDAESVISFDWSKLMKGNIRELEDQMGSIYSTPEGVVCLSMIVTVEKDGEKKDYEQVYNRDFMPGYVMKDIRLKSLDDEFISRAKATEKKKRSRLQKFMLQVTDSEHGIKDYFYRGELTEYDPTQNVVTSDTSHIRSDDASY